MDKKTIVEAMRDMDLCFMSTAAKGGGRVVASDVE